MSATVKALLTAFLVSWVLAGVGRTAWAEDKPPRPGKKDKCPVCGMFVYKYRPWVAVVVYKDREAVFFDGAKDLFKYLSDVPRFTPARKREDVDSVFVTDYYDTDLVPASTALYVTGGDVMGPMGHELVPLRTRAEAEEFMKDHKGKGIFSYTNVTAAVVEQLGAR